MDQVVYVPDDSAAQAWRQKANEETKYANRVIKLANALSAVLKKIAPNHPLAKRENRLKIVNGEPVDFDI